MSVYTSDITTRFVDPVFDKQNFRSEFRLQDDTAYLSNMRLTGLGIQTSAGNEYNGLLGAVGCIKAITLYDGNVVLDSLKEASLWNAFKSYNNSNDYNVSMNRFLKHNNLGFVASGNQTVDASNNNRLILSEPKIRTQNPSNVNGDQAWVSLKQMLPFLGSSMVVPTTLFKKLRIVVEWKSVAESNDVIKQTNQITNTYSDCVLVVDEINPGDVRDSLMSSYKGVAYRPIEHDRVFVDAVTGMVDAAPEVQQQNKYNVAGFNNKTLHSLTVVQTPQDATTYRTGTTNTEYSNQGSMSQWKPQYQFRVNGANKLERNGWTGKNQRLAHLSDIMGECNTIPGNNMVHLTEGANCMDNSTSRIGTLDYTSVSIEDRIQELQIDFTRTGVYNNANTSQQLALNLFGEVDKAVVPNKNGYSVVYN